MRPDELDDSAPGRRQNWWAAAVVLLLFALACVSAGVWAGAAVLVLGALVVLLISFRVRA